VPVRPLRHLSRITDYTTETHSTERDFKKREVKIGSAEKGSS